MEQKAFSYVLMCKTIELKEGVLSFSHDCKWKKVLLFFFKLIFSQHKPTDLCRFTVS